MSWSKIEIAGKPADVFIPPSETVPGGVVLFLHGSDGITLVENEAFTQVMYLTRNVRRYARD